jgi:hypothetical protein
MAWVQIAVAAGQAAYGIYSKGKQQREELRAARDQQRRDNEEIRRLILDEPRQEIRGQAQRNLAFSGAGVRGGTATQAAVDLDALQQTQIRQEELARQIDTSLLGQRTEMDPMTQLWRSYYENVWKKPGQQVADEAKRVGKRIGNEFKRFGKRLGF